MYYVYGLLNPFKNNEIFYIGKGKNKRFKDHYKPSMLCNTNHKNNTIKNYRLHGFKDSYIVIKDNLTEDEALELEENLIREQGIFSDGGVLTNCNYGGQTGAKLFGHNNPSVKAALKNIHWSKGNKNYFYSLSPWNSYNATELSKYTWSVAEKILTISKENPNLGYRRVRKLCEEILNSELNEKSVFNIMKYHKNGWIPNNDIEWTKFISTYKK